MSHCHVLYQNPYAILTKIKGHPIDIYLLLFLFIILAGSVAVYIYYLKDKNEQLNAIRSGRCPKCHKEESIVLSDKRGGGCGPKLVSFYCIECGYENSFSIDGGCGI